MLGVAVELALVCYIGFTGSLARPGASVVVIFSVEVMHYRVLSVNQFVDVGHEVTNGFGIGFVDLLEQLDIGDSFFVVGNDVVVFDTCEGVAVLEVAVGVFTESFVCSHPYSSDVVSIARTIVGHLVVGRE
jgi:hypothetical protein